MKRAAQALSGRPKRGRYELRSAAVAPPSSPARRGPGAAAAPETETHSRKAPGAAAAGAGAFAHGAQLVVVDVPGVAPDAASLPRALEAERWAAGAARVAGVDEAGRGPLAGPVVAAACVIPSHVHFPGINDSVRGRRTRELARDNGL